MIIEATQKLLRQENLTIQEMQRVMEEITGGQSHTGQIVSFLSGLNKKGYTSQEITAAVRVMRVNVTRINTDQKTILDTCGTGGDKKGTFNVSTIAAFVAASCGITVAKHGNRSVSSCCGSADILEALGIEINLSKQQLEKCLKDIGIAFLFAPNLHPAMKFAMPARQKIPEKTIFNVLGPLTNPAFATHQLVGVYSPQLVASLAEVFKNLGTAHALVVHGEDGLDEITTTAATLVAEENRGKITRYKIKPEDFGFKRAKLEDLTGGSISDNLRILEGVLAAKAGPYRDMVLFNAGAAIYTADKVKSIKEGIRLAEQALDSGRAREKLDLLKEYSHRPG